MTDDNPSWEAFTGQATPSTWASAGSTPIHPDDRAGVRDALAGRVAGRALVELQYRLRRHDGDYREIEAQGAPVIDGDQRARVGRHLPRRHRQQACRSGAAAKARSSCGFLDRLGQATRATDRCRPRSWRSPRACSASIWAPPAAPTPTSRPTATASPSAATGPLPGVAEQRRRLFARPVRAAGDVEPAARPRTWWCDDVDRELGDEGGGRMFNAIGIKAIICAGAGQGRAGWWR